MEKQKTIRLLEDILVVIKIVIGLSLILFPLFVKNVNHLMITNTILILVWAIVKYRTKTKIKELKG